MITKKQYMLSSLPSEPDPRFNSRYLNVGNGEFPEGFIKQVQFEAFVSMADEGRGRLLPPQGGQVLPSPAASETLSLPPSRAECPGLPFCPKHSCWFLRHSQAWGPSFSQCHPLSPIPVGLDCVTPPPGSLQQNLRPYVQLLAAPGNQERP